MAQHTSVPVMKSASKYTMSPAFWAFGAVCEEGLPLYVSAAARYKRIEAGSHSAATHWLMLANPAKGAQRKEWD